MIDFEDAYTLWRRHPFPGHGLGNVLPDTFSDLVLADHYVMTVIPFVEQGTYKPAVPDVLALLRSVRRRIEDNIDKESPEMQMIAREQHAYAALLHAVYEHFLGMATTASDPKDGMESAQDNGIA